MNALELFHGAANPAAAHVYARWDVPLNVDDRAGLSLSGTLLGPHSLYSRTLPARVAFRNLGAGDALLAEAFLPDPCFWTPESPFTYEAEVELRRGAEVIDVGRHTFGIRPLGVRGRDLNLDGRRWVLRGVQRANVAPNELAAWHALGAAMVTESPDEALSRDASRDGVFLVAMLNEGPESIRERLRTLSRWPAVGIAVLPSGMDETHLDVRPRNLLLAQQIDAEQSWAVAPWADLLFARVGTAPQHFESLGKLPLPVIIAANSDNTAALEEARAACDRLQGAWSAVGDFAGYVV